MKKKLKRNKNSHEILKTSKSNSNVFHYKKDVETVEKLNFFDYNKSEPSYNIFKLKSSPKKFPLMKIKTIDSINTNILDKLNSIEDDPEEIINKYEKDLNQFNISLNKLKQSYPNNLDLLELEKYTGIKAPTRTEHIKLENNLTRQISSCEKEENELKNQKETLETELVNIDKKIIDQQLNLEVFNQMDNESSNKIIMEKFVKKFEDDEVNKKKSNKDFREQLDLYIQKEEYNKRLKMREIGADINYNKDKKKVLTKKLNIINGELKNIHKKKNIIIMKLYNHYLSILSEGKDTRNEGLCWIIKEIFGLKKKVMLSCLPNFLDKLCIKYLFNMTHLNKEIADVEHKIKITKEEFKNLSVVNKEKNFLNNKNYLSQTKRDNNSNNYLDEKNEAMNDYLKSIRQTFCRPNNFNANSFLKNNNSQLSIFPKRNNLNNNNNNNKIHSFKKKKSLFNLPFINGDPNSLTDSLNKNIAYINKLSKDEINEYIPNVLKVKDVAEMCKNSGYFMNSDEVRKVKTYFDLNKTLNSLRKKKETMKTNEMTRIFNEFQKNNYAQRFNIDKISVINALIGEDNINGELVKQAKREKQYIEESMRIKMHKNIMISGKSASVRNLFGGSQYFGIKTNSNLISFENIKNIGDSNKKRFNSLGNNNI